MQRPQATSGTRMTAASSSSSDSVSGLSSSAAPQSASAPPAARPPSSPLRLTPFDVVGRYQLPIRISPATTSGSSGSGEERQGAAAATQRPAAAAGRPVAAGVGPLLPSKRARSQPRPDSAADHSPQLAQPRSSNLSRHRTRPPAPLFDDEGGAAPADPQTAAAAAADRPPRPSLPFRSRPQQQMAPHFPHSARGEARDAAGGGRDSDEDMAEEGDGGGRLARVRAPARRGRSPSAERNFRSGSLSGDHNSNRSSSVGASSSRSSRSATPSSFSAASDGSSRSDQRSRSRSRTPSVNNSSRTPSSVSSTAVTSTPRSVHTAEPNYVMAVSQLGKGKGADHEARAQPARATDGGSQLSRLTN